MSNLTTHLSSATQTISISRDGPARIIGERINPTGRKALSESLARGDFSLIQRDAVAQVEAGAALLDLNVGVPGLDEPALMAGAIRAISEVTDIPLCLDSANPRALEAGLRACEGADGTHPKALLNSVNGEEKSLAAILPLVREHHAAVIGLCMDEAGIPETAQGRLQVAAKIVERAAQMGIPAEDVIVDPLVLAVSAAPGAPQVTLHAARLIAAELGVNLTLGASNVSFGLPRREAINLAFLSMALAHGVTCPIANPLAPGVRETVLAADLLLGKDEWAMNWIADYRSQQT